jgi:hypothetical protein
MIYYHCPRYTHECQNKATQGTGSHYDCLVFRPEEESKWFITGINKDKVKFGYWTCWINNHREFINTFIMKNYPQNEDDNGQLRLL